MFEIDSVENDEQKIVSGRAIISRMEGENLQDYARFMGIL